MPAWAPGAATSVTSEAITTLAAVLSSVSVPVWEVSETRSGTEWAVTVVLPVMLKSSRADMSSRTSTGPLTESTSIASACDVTGALITIALASLLIVIVPSTPVVRTAAVRSTALSRAMPCPALMPISRFDRTSELSETVPATLVNSILPSTTVIGARTCWSRLPAMAVSLTSPVPSGVPVTVTALVRVTSVPASASIVSNAVTFVRLAASPAFTATAPAVASTSAVVVTLPRVAVSVMSPALASSALVETTLPLAESSTMLPAAEVTTVFAVRFVLALNVTPPVLSVVITPSVVMLPLALASDTSPVSASRSAAAVRVIFVSPTRAMPSWALSLASISSSSSASILMPPSTLSTGALTSMSLTAIRLTSPAWALRAAFTKMSPAPPGDVIVEI